MIGFGYGNSMFLATHGILTGRAILPVNTVAPAITGTAQEGQTLTCSTGTWTGTPPITYTYQWKRNGSNIGSATNSTYLLVSADVGQSILCTVTATNGAGSVNANSNTVTPVSSGDADAQAFITAASITDPTQQSAINQLVVDLKGYNIWTKMKALYPFVGGTSTTHKFNLKNPLDTDAAFRLVFSGGWTHSSTGALPNGTNGYADTKLNAASNLNQNDTHMSIYVRTNNTSDTVAIAASRQNNPSLNIFPNFSGSSYFRVNSNPDGAVSTGGSHLGFWIGNRISSTQTRNYRNTTRYVIATSSTGVVSQNVWLASSPDYAVNFYSNQIAFASVGNGLSDTEAANYYTAVQAFQTTLGRQV